MKILFFHRWTGVHLGGTETHVRELMELLVGRGHEVTLLTRQGDYPRGLDPRVIVRRVSCNLFEADHSYENLVLLYFNTGLFMAKSFFYLLFLWLIGREKFDVISVHFATEAVVCRLLKRLTGTPYVFVLEGYTALEADEARRADLAMAISKHEVEETFKHHGYKPLYLPKGRNSYFNPEVDGRVRRQQYLGQAEKLLLAVGRIESRKDYPTLVAAARILKNSGRNYRWLIAGDGIDFQKIKQLINREGLDDTVLMLGAVDNKELPRLYRASDLFVLPTLYEGFGFVYVEAMACGLPVVSTTVGAVSEVVGEAGVMVEPKNPEALAEAVLRVLTDDNLHRNLVVNALAKAAEYDWDLLIGQYEKAYQGVISDSRSRRIKTPGVIS